MTTAELIQTANAKPKGTLLVILYIHAYAEGITGRDMSNLIVFSPDGLMFESTKAAREFIKEKNKHGMYKSIETRKNRGYGKLGTFYSPSFIKGRDVEKFFKDNMYDNCGYREIKP
jgi:hypothetical protein